MAKSPPISPASPLQQIGETAGAVWHALRKHGPLSLAKLVETVGANRDVVMQAIGWLAREDKLGPDRDETGANRVAPRRRNELLRAAAAVQLAREALSVRDRESDRRAPTGVRYPRAIG
jgi:hypothetical protein